MGFKISDLIIESILQEGFEAIRRDPSILDDVFAELNNINPIINKKFGDKEISRIKTYFTTKEISIIQAFPQDPSKVPCISIQLQDNSENVRYAHIDDFSKDTSEDLTDPEDLEALIKVDEIVVTAYNSNTGKLSITDGSDLSSVTVNNLFVDASGVEFPIIGGILIEDGSKQVTIAAGQTVDISDFCQIKSSINFTQKEERGNVEDERLLLGIHTEERLLTIYLYILTKYFIVSRKKDLINRGFSLATYSGSDFTRNMDYAANLVYSRYLTISGITENSWESDVITAIENFDVKVLVGKDKATTEDLGLEDQTVQVSDDPQE